MFNCNAIQNSFSGVNRNLSRGKSKRRLGWLSRRESVVVTDSWNFFKMVLEIWNYFRWQMFNTKFTGPGSAADFEDKFSERWKISICWVRIAEPPYFKKVCPKICWQIHFQLLIVYFRMGVPPPHFSMFSYFRCHSAEFRGK